MGHSSGYFIFYLFDRAIAHENSQDRRKNNPHISRHEIFERDLLLPSLLLLLPPLAPVPLPPLFSLTPAPAVVVPPVFPDPALEGPVVVVAAVGRGGGEGLSNDLGVPNRDNGQLLVNFWSTNKLHQGLSQVALASLFFTSKQFRSKKFRLKV